MLKVIIAGGRDYASTNDYGFANYIYSQLPSVNFDVKQIEIVHGGCPTGADQYAQRFADNHGIKCTVFNADWKTYKRAAGPIRNTQMAKYGDMLIAFWDGKSAGTKDMIRKMQTERKPVKVVGY